MYDPEYGKIHVNRDVVFQEERSWQWENVHEDEREMRTWATFTVEGQDDGPTGHEGVAAHDGTAGHNDVAVHDDAAGRVGASFPDDASVLGTPQAAAASTAVSVLV